MDVEHGVGPADDLSKVFQDHLLTSRTILAAAPEGVEVFIIPNGVALFKFEAGRVEQGHQDQSAGDGRGIELFD